MTSATSVVLGHLAATRWFTEHGEVALTAGLTYCLEKDPPAAEAFIQMIRERTGFVGSELPVPARWQAEAIYEDRARIDIAGWVEATTEPAPVVFVEAKVSADFGPRQVSSYLESQQRSLRRAGINPGALVVLVPESRVRSAREEIAGDIERLGPAAGDNSWIVDGPPTIRVAVVSWDDALDAMVDANGPSAADLEQLRGACQALQGADVLALNEADLTGGWHDRKDDLRRIIDRVTREATTELSLAPLPWVPHGSNGLEGGFRYIGASGQPNLAVGMRADGLDPPLWVRWISNYADLVLVEARLTQAGHLFHKLDGRLWVPLEIQADTGSAKRQIAHLVDQIVALYKISVDWNELAC
jgi:hypothetical protein